MLATRLPLRLAVSAGQPYARVARPALSAILSTQSPRISYTVSRNFASPGRPRKSDAEKKTTAKPRQPKSTTTKKAASKSTTTKKAAPKPKTEEQLAAKKLRDDKRNAKAALDALKAQALSPPRTNHVNVYSVFVTEIGKGKPTGADISTFAKSASEAWKNISSTEREHYNHLANEQNRAMDREYEDWLRNQTPESIRLANIARRRLRTLVSHSGKAKYAALKDDREVKRPLTSWVLYFVDRNASGDFRGIGAIQRAKDISAEYRSLSASELKEYEDRAAKDIQRYKREYYEVYGHEPSISTRKRSKSPSADDS